MVVLDGEAGPWLPKGFEVIPQRGDGLDARLASAFEDVAEPAFLIGMDAPQVTPELLLSGAALLAEDGTDAVLGAAEDGGYWAVGLHEPGRDVFDGVGMSRDDTAALQRSRLAELQLTSREMPVLRDVDRFEDALHVAREATGAHFAAAVERVKENAGSSEAEVR